MLFKDFKFSLYLDLTEGDIFIYGDVPIDLNTSLVYSLTPTVGAVAFTYSIISAIENWAT